MRRMIVVAALAAGCGSDGSSGDTRRVQPPDAASMATYAGMLPWLVDVRWPAMGVTVAMRDGWPVSGMLSGVPRIGCSASEVSNATISAQLTPTLDFGNGAALWRATTTTTVGDKLMMRIDGACAGMRPAATAEGLIPMTGP